MVEQETRALVSAPWWSATLSGQRAQAIAGRALTLPDGTYWIFGAWARWYRWHPGERTWNLCPPPQSPVTRRSARPGPQGMGVSEPPPHVVPAGPDFDTRLPKPLPFVGQDFGPDLTARLKSTLEAAAQLPASDYPHWWGTFSTSVPSAVAAAWGAMLWSASAPVFDSHYDGGMLGLWAPYRAKPLPAVDGPRWLTPPPLEALVGLYAERLRAHRPDAATVVLRTMWAVARVLRDDVRFRARADALIAILGATLANPQADYAVLAYGDQALVQQWLTRVPPDLAPAVRIESSAGDNVRHTFYELVTSLVRVCGDPGDPSFIEPRLVGAALVAADLAVCKRHVVEKVVPWLDPEIRYTVQAVLDQAGHPLRRLWPKDGRMPDGLRANLGGRAAALLAAVYAADLGWCRLGGIPARPRGFPVPTALIGELIGPGRASAASAAPITAPPGVGTPAGPPAGFEPTPSHPAPGAAEQLGAALGRGAFDVPAPVAPEPPPQEAPAAAWVPPYTMLGFDSGKDPAAPAVGPDLKAVPFGQDESDDPYQPPAPGPRPDEVQWSPGYTMLGFGKPPAGDPGEQPAESADAPASPFSPPVKVQPPTRVLRPEAPAEDIDPQAAQQPEQPVVDEGATVPDADESDFDLRRTRRDDEPTAEPPDSDADPEAPPPTRLDGDRKALLDAPPPSPVQPGGPGQPVPPRPGGAEGVPGTRIMSGTMVGEFLDAARGERPAVPVPVPEGPAYARVEAYGVGFVGGTGPDTDVQALLRKVRRDLTWAKSLFEPGAEPVKGAPNVLLVGEPHSGQRRVARMVALALAEAGVGDGSVRAAGVDAIQGASAQGFRAVLDPGGGPCVVVLVERLDEAIGGAEDAAAVQAVRLNSPARTALVAACDPRAYRRLAAVHPELVAGFQVVHLPDLSEAAGRLAVLNVLADERRVAVDAAAFQTVQRDLTRLHGLGEQSGARLVEDYLDRAAQRHLSRLGAAPGRLVLTTEDFAGVAEEIEPVHRPAGDADLLLRRLDQMIGIGQIKEAVHRLADAARAGQGGQRHLVLLGRPGTGKSTVAELVGGIYASLGLLSTGQIVSCRPVHLAGRDPFDTESRVHGLVEKARGGILLIGEADRLERHPDVVQELCRVMRERAGRFIVICTSAADGFEAYLLNHPEFRELFGEIVRFVELTDRELVQLFQQQAERDLYTLDEELRVELMSRFARLRADPGFAFGRTAREMFEQTVARQSARLRGAQLSAAAVTRLSVGDLPETVLQHAFRDFRRQ